MKKPVRIEWISVLYLVFFVLAVLAPSMQTRSLFGFSETQLEELTIFAFGIAGLLTFTAYERLMERREKEREQTEMDYSRAKHELIESYAYIGSVNRKIELLKKIANNTSKTLTEAKTVPKEVLQALAMNACLSIGAKAALIRFVDTEKLRTEGEFLYSSNAEIIFRVPNKDLKTLREQGVSHAFIRSEDDHEILVVPSDLKSNMLAYILIKLDGDEIRELDVPLLKVFANQAELVYRSFRSTPPKKEEKPLAQG